MASSRRGSASLVALDMIDAEMAGQDLGRWATTSPWPTVPPAPPLFYIDRLFPLADTHKNAARYLDRLLERPSYARVIEEANPYFTMFPF